MPIFHLSEREDCDLAEWAKAHGVTYWPYTDTHGFVIVAPDEKTAREIAMKEAEKPWWRAPEATSCVAIQDDGVIRVVMGNYPTG